MYRTRWRSGRFYHQRNRGPYPTWNQLYVPELAHCSLSCIFQARITFLKITRCSQNLSWSFECPLMSLSARECGSILSVRVSPPSLLVPEPGMFDNWVWAAVYRGLKDLWKTRITPIQRERLRHILRKMQEYGFTG